LGLLLALPAVVVWWQSRGHAPMLDWQPRLALAEPWRWWSAAWVHLSRMHLLANLGGTALVLALGWAAQVPARAMLAWALAWPLTHLALLLQPQLASYGGLSGVLHAGVAVVAVHLGLHGSRAQRALALAIGIGLLGKVLSETPWRGPLVFPEGWDIAVAPLAHAAGALSGAAMACLLLARRAPRTPPG
jgi:rhomboid family GlyGly-CTERM serine protease